MTAGFGCIKDKYNSAFCKTFQTSPVNREKTSTADFKKIPAMATFRL
jgi:hypothetical protein